MEHPPWNHRIASNTPRTYHLNPVPVGVTARSNVPSQPHRPQVQTQMGSQSLYDWQGWSHNVGSTYPVAPPQLQFASPWRLPPQFPFMDQPSFDDFAAALVEKMRPMLVDRGSLSTTPTLSNEHSLRDALRAAKSNGLTPRQFMESLQMEQHQTQSSDAEWKGVLVELLKYCLPPEVPEPQPNALSQGQRTGQQIETLSTHSLIRDLSPHHTMHTRAATQRHAPHPSMHPAGERDSAEGILSPSLSPASDRSRPAFTLPEYHANTLIPPSSTSTKPHCPPRRDPRSNRNPFTPDDKIFFIHWLRWRLREGAVPPRAVLEWELGQETPQHDEKAWKKHWDDNPLLPDQIYIAACQRAKNEIRIFEERELVLSPAPTPSVASNDELPTDRRHGRERTLGYRNNSDLPKVSASPRARRSRATEQDLRAMAHYLFEKRAVWNKEFSSHYEAWKRFGERPENRTRRSPNAWNCLARVYATKIEQYCDEYIAKSGTEGEPHEDIQRISSIN